LLWLLVGTASCGRLGFEKLEAEVGGSGDAGLGGKADAGAAGGHAGAATGGAAGVAGEAGAGGTGGSAVLCPPSCPPGTLFSSGFETPYTQTTRVGGNAVIALDPTQPHSGSYSLHVTQGVPGTQAGLNFDFVPVVNTTIYFRAWLYIPSPGPVEGYKIVDFSAGGAPKTDINVSGDQTMSIFNQTMGPMTMGPWGHLPWDRWLCLQVTHYVSTTGNVAVSIDGTPVVSQGPIDTLPPSGAVDQIGLGALWTFTTETHADVYFDDVVASLSPLGCY